MSMQDIQVKNEELLGLLDSYRDFLLKDVDLFQSNFHLSSKEESDNRSWWVGEKHLKEIVDQKENHEGFPDAIYGYELSVHRKNHEFFTKNASPVSRKEITAQLSNMGISLMQWLGVKHNALTAFYPPGGFISWHNNANAAAYNLVFSWSETGNGCFKYVDPTTKEVVVMKDHAGWQCKAAYFGHYGEPDRLFYHAAETDCWRITVSFTFDTSELSEEYRQELIEEISTE